MHHRPVHAVEHLVEDWAAAGDGTERHEAAGEGLGQRNDVRLHPPVLAGQEAAGPPHARLNLVGDKQRAVFTAELGRLGEVVVVRQVDPLALDRLDDEGGDPVLRQGALKRRQVIKGNLGAVPEQRREAFPIERVRGDREGAVSQPVVAVAAVQNALPAGGVARELQRRFDSLCAGVAEVHLLEPGHMAVEPLSQQPGEQRNVELNHTGHLAVQNLLEGVDHCRVIAAEREDAETAEMVEILTALLVEEVRAFAVRVADIEADGAENADELRIEMPLEERKALSVTAAQQPFQVNRHKHTPQNLCGFRTIPRQDRFPKLNGRRAWLPCVEYLVLPRRGTLDCVSKRSNSFARYNTLTGLWDKCICPLSMPLR